MLSELDKNIFNKIITSESYLSGALLSQLCNVSINTIRKEIDIINDCISNYGCHIETKIAQGYVFVIDNEKIALPFIEQTLVDYRRYRYLNLADMASVYYVLRKLIINNEFYTPESLANEMFCSKSTILRVLEKAKEFLSFYSLEIRSKRNYGIQISGNEWNRRLCMLDLHKAYIHSNEFNDTRFEAAFLMNSNYPEQVKKTLYHYFSNHPELKISNLNFPKIYNLILLSETRKQNNSLLKFTDTQIISAKRLPSWQHAANIYDALPELFHNSEKEHAVLCLSMLLATSLTITDFREIPEQDIKKYQSETIEMLQFLNQYYQLDYLFNLEFIQDFSCYLHSLNLSLLFNVPTDREMLAPSFRLGLLSADLLSLFALFFYQKHGYRLKETDLVKAYYIFARFIFENQNSSFKKRILLCPRYGFYFGKNLASRIYNQFGNHIHEIQVAEFSELYSIDLSQYDLIATDILAKSLPATQTPVIEINFFRTSEDMSKLQKFLTDSNKSLALSIFKSDNYHQLNCQSKEEILNCFFKLHQNEFNNKDAFINEVYLRDQFINSERDKGIVLISTLTLKTESPVFDVIVTSKPILWNSQRSTIFIFYQYGDGTSSNIQLISYLLGQFIHQSDSFLNSLSKLTYNELIDSFKN